MNRYSLTFFCIFLFTLAQAQLTLRPSLPSFLRNGDHIELAAEIANASNAEVTGQVQLELTEFYMGYSVDGWFLNTFPNQYFTVAAGGREIVHFPVQVPAQFYGRLSWKLSASAATTAAALRDTRAGDLPVLSDRVLRTASVNVSISNNGRANFQLTPLVQKGNREGIQHHALIGEYITDPRWYAADAMRIMMMTEADNLRESWVAYGARALALSILHRHGAAARNDLDSALLEYTAFPQDEPTRPRKRSSAEEDFVYDQPRLEGESRAVLSRLSSMQIANGSFPWMRGGPTDNNTTIALLAGIGQLEKLNAVPSADRDSLETLKRRALRYLDATFATGAVKDSSNLIPYLYVRSFFGASEITSEARIAIDRALRNAAARWKEAPKGMQAMLALALWRSGDHKLPLTIIASAASSKSSEANDGLWWQQPVEIRAMILSAAAESGSPLLGSQLEALLSLREGYDWGTPAASLSASFAILQATSNVIVRPSGALSVVAGQFASSLPATTSGRRLWAMPEQRIDSSQGKGNIITGDSTGHFHLTWQYFDENEKVPTTPLRIEKTIFHIPVGRAKAKAITEGEELRIGDTLLVQLRLNTTRDLNYIRVDDGWASLLAVAEARGGQRMATAQEYYRITGTHDIRFYFPRLTKGSYLLSYRTLVTRGGTGGSVQAAAQCVEAPSIKARSGTGVLTAVQ